MFIKGVSYLSMYDTFSKDCILKNKVRFYREYNNLTQTDLAKLCGVSQNTISNIENYVFQPSGKLCLALCIALNVPFDILFYVDNSEEYIMYDLPFELTSENHFTNGIDWKYKGVLNLCR